MVYVPSTPCRSPTNVAGLSRMTITVLASSSAMGQVVKQLNGDLFIYYTYIFNPMYYSFALLLQEKDLFVRYEQQLLHV